MNPFETASRSLGKSAAKRGTRLPMAAGAPASWGNNAKWLFLISGCVLFASLSQMAGGGGLGADNAHAAVGTARGPHGASATRAIPKQATGSDAESAEGDPSESASSSDDGDGTRTEQATSSDVRIAPRRRLPYADEANVPPPPCTPDEISTSELTTFPFWGTTYNTSYPCPTSGMNNQMQMLMFYQNCREAHGKPVLQWKDISCSPTGGVQKNGGRYEVGSKSYSYTWFRWSSLFNVTKGGICYADNYTWSMHSWLKGCGFTDSANKRFYGTDSYWKQRPLFDFRESYYVEVERFLQGEGLAGEKFLAVHLRRGDYSKFCKEIKKSYKKLRLAHWKWAKARGARDLYDRHSHTCAPDKGKVVAGINRLLELHGVSHVLMATTDPDFLPGSAEFEKEIRGKLHAFNASNYAMSAAAYTAVDSILLARATHRILNRYSTLSLTAVDLSVIRGWFNNETTWFW
ncbi:hypothetical protein DIPPA_14285 [Diplonema papillatum]|nr:hypothetical protein DIPPA_14285 [Diplonema papillatum]|eukprot:gene7973-12242_t